MSSTFFFAPEKTLWSYDKYFKIYSKKLTPPQPPSGTWCKHSLILKFVGDFWMSFIFTWYVHAVTMLGSKAFDLGSDYVLDIHEQELFILRKLRLNVRHCDFIHSLEHMQCLTWCSVSVCTIAFSSIYHFWIMQFEGMIMKCTWLIL